MATTDEFIEQVVMSRAKPERINVFLWFAFCGSRGMLDGKAKLFRRIPILRTVYMESSIFNHPYGCAHDAEIHDAIVYGERERYIKAAGCLNATDHLLVTIRESTDPHFCSVERETLSVTTICKEDALEALLSENVTGCSADVLGEKCAEIFGTCTPISSFDIAIATLPDFGISFGELKSEINCDRLYRVLDLCKHQILFSCDCSSDHLTEERLEKLRTAWTVHFSDAFQPIDAYIPLVLKLC